MSATDADILLKVRQWLDYGDEDLRLAMYAMNIVDCPPYRLAAYHAQQSAEKSLKAYLVYCRTDFPYTHNLSRLVEFYLTTTTVCPDSGPPYLSLRPLHSARGKFGDAS